MNPQSGWGDHLKMIGLTVIWATVIVGLCALIGVLTGVWLPTVISGFIFGAAILVGAITPWLTGEPLSAAATLRASTLDQIDAMTGIEFEEYVAGALRELGFTVDLTAVTGDFGVDLVATRNGIRTAVQCKRQAKPVGTAAIQQVVAGAAMHRCTAFMVVTNQSFTPAARRIAGQHRCKLVDRTKLLALGRALGV